MTVIIKILEIKINNHNKTFKNLIITLIQVVVQEGVLVVEDYPRMFSNSIKSNNMKMMITKIMKIMSKIKYKMKRKKNKSIMQKVII